MLPKTRPQESEAEKLTALRALIAQGLADADAGDLFDGDEVFDELQARFPAA